MREAGPDLRARCFFSRAAVGQWRPRRRLV